MTLMRSPVHSPLRSPLHSPLVGKWGALSLEQQVAAFLPDVNCRGFYCPWDETSLRIGRDGSGGAPGEDDVVGMILDKTQMGGQTAEAFIAAQPELVSNGGAGFAGVDGWTSQSGGSMTESGGQGIFTTVDGDTVGGARYEFTTVAGQWYFIDYDVDSFNSISYQIGAGDIGTNPNLVSTPTSATDLGVGRLAFKATGTTTYIIVYARGNGVGDQAVIFNYLSTKPVPGNHEPATSDAARSLYRHNGIYRYIEHDGVDDQYGPIAFPLTQPYDRLSAPRQKTWSDGDTLFDGGTTNTGRLNQSGSSPNIAMAAGSTAPVLTGFAVNAWGVITERFDDAGSELILNTGTAATGNPGSADAGGLTTGARASGAFWANFDLAGLIVTDTPMTDEQITLCRQLLAEKSGVTL